MLNSFKNKVLATSMRLLWGNKLKTRSRFCAAKHHISDAHFIRGLNRLGFTMEKFFVPYSGDAPAAVEINGHRVLIVTTLVEDILGELDLVGGDEIREFDLEESGADSSEIMADLAADINGGVVLTPPGVTPSSLIENLEAELPWIH